MNMSISSLERSFEEHNSCLSEIDERLQSTRQRLVEDLINRMQTREREWQETFKDILSRSQEESNQTSGDNFRLSDLLKSGNNFATFNPVSKTTTTPTTTASPQDQSYISIPVKENDKPKQLQEQIDIKHSETRVETVKIPETATPKTIQPVDPQTERVTIYRKSNKDFNDPEFSNFFAIQEFVRIQAIMAKNRDQLSEMISNPILKSYRNELNIFIRTQINSISNSDNQHLKTKISQLTRLFNGNTLPYQNKTINATNHPQGQLYCLDQAAQIFVTVGTRLVNSVPAIARSMAVVINGIADDNMPLFRDLVIGHLQERCPFIVPVYPDPSDLAGQPDPEVKYRIACGYCYDAKTESLETEEKYLARIRSMVLIYACVLSQGQINHAWSWLASFLSLYPEPVTTPTVLQAYLQMASQKLSAAFGNQYNKLLAFIRTKYVPMIEEISTKPSDKQPLVKLKNLLSDEQELIASKPVGNIFGSIRYG